MAQLVYLCFRDNILNESFTDLIDMKYDHLIKVSKPHFNLKEFDKVSQLIELCNDLKREYKKSNGVVSASLFHLALEQLRVLNRIYEIRTNWMIPLVFQSGEQLYNIARTLDKQRESGINSSADDGEEESFLIQAGRAIHMTLNICFKDRNENMEANKKTGVFYFGTLLFKLYYRIKAYGLLSNMCKVFESRLNEINPYLPRVQNDLIVIRFKFYMGLYYGYEKANYELGQKWLQEAYQLCIPYRRHKKTHPIVNRVLLHLVPVTILHSKRYPRLQVLKKLYPPVFRFYKPLVESLCDGNLGTFNQFITDNQLFLVSKNLYVAVLRIKELVQLKLVKLTWTYNGSATKLPLRKLHAAFQLSNGGHVTSPSELYLRNNSTLIALDRKQNKDEPTAIALEEQLDQLECILATLISRNYIKGYLSHSHRVMMTSKTPFPSLVIRK